MHTFALLVNNESYFSGYNIQDEEPSFCSFKEGNIVVVLNHNPIGISVAYRAYFVLLNLLGLRD